MKSCSSKLYNYVFYFLILLISVYIYSIDGTYSDFRVLFTNFLIILFSLLFMVFGDKFNYSLNKIFMLFSFFFFGIAPALQYQKGIVLWGGSSFSSDSYFRLNIIILCILFMYQGMYFIFYKLKTGKLDLLLLKKCQTKRELSGTILVMLSLISLLITLHFNNYNLANLLLRGGGEVERLAVNQSISLIYSNFIRPIPVICLIFFKKYGLKNIKLEVVLIILVLTSNFPTSAARFYIAALYIPLLILYIKQFSKNYLLLNKTIMLGLLVIFPFLDQVRRIHSINDLKFSLDFQMFLQGHFDSYQMFMRVVDENFITMGQQLLTAIFFFIPRSIWPNKSIGSGHLVSQKFGLSFDNISMNFFGEGYINFGFIGILVFTIAIAFINAKLDKMYWLKSDKYNWMSIFYLLLLGLEFFILRGDLLSSFAFTMGMTASVFFVNLVSSRTI